MRLREKDTGILEELKAQFLHNLLQNSASDSPSLGPSASGYAEQLASEGIPDVAT
jgi:hypothetical protein